MVDGFYWIYCFWDSNNHCCSSARTIYANHLATRVLIRLGLNKSPKDVSSEKRLAASCTSRALTQRGLKHSSFMWTRTQLARHITMHNICKRGKRWCSCMGIITYHPHLLFKSGANIEITLRLQSALERVDTRLLDHLVVAAEGIMSLAERGLRLITLAVVQSTFLLESAA